VLVAAISYVPFLQNVFQTGPIGIKEWLFLFILPIPIVLLEEARKAIARKMARNKLINVGGK